MAELYNAPTANTEGLSDAAIGVATFLVRARLPRKHSIECTPEYVSVLSRVVLFISKLQCYGVAVSLSSALDFMDCSV